MPNLHGTYKTSLPDFREKNDGIQLPKKKREMELSTTLHPNSPSIPSYVILETVGQAEIAPVPDAVLQISLF
ncbi:hypothetical protein V6N13_090563 [Hibiscus sabdariffa]